MAKKYSLHIPEKLYIKLKAEAARLGITVAAVIKMSIALYLDSKKGG